MTQKEIKKLVTGDEEDYTWSANESPYKQTAKTNKSFIGLFIFVIECFTPWNISKQFRKNS